MELERKRLQALTRCPDKKAFFSRDLVLENATQEYEAVIKLYRDQKEPTLTHYTVRAKYSNWHGCSGTVCHTLKDKNGIHPNIHHDGSLSEDSMPTLVIFNSHGCCVFDTDFQCFTKLDDHH